MTQRRIKLFGKVIWAINYTKCVGWFRLFGIGLRWKHQSLDLIFSERNGYKKYVKIGKWIITYLPYNKP